MKPNRKQRPKRHRENRAKAARAQHGASATISVAERDSSKRPLGRLSMIIVVLYVLIGAYWILRVRTGANIWPTHRDVGMDWAWGIVAVGGLVVASALMAWGVREVGPNGRLPVRVLLSGALLGGLLVVGVRSFEYYRLYRAGIFPLGTPHAVHDHADIYYVQCVREKLKQHWLRLEEKPVDRPATFAEEDQRQLELVSSLQIKMVAWTEQEVGHWLDDLNERRSLIAVLAYQVHPLARNRAAVQTRIKVEREAIQHNRRRFTLLRAYCERKSELFARLGNLNQQMEASRSASKRGSEQAPRDGSTESGKPPSQKKPLTVQPALLEKEIKGLRADIARIDEEVLAKLDEMRDGDWAFADSITNDTSDLSMAGERLNLIEERLRRLDARQEFLREWLDPLLENQDPAGLNAEHAWLRLPVCIPSGSAWVSFFFLATGSHVVLILFAIGALVVVWPGKSNAVPADRLPVVASLWHAATLVGVVLFVMFYCG